MIWFKTNMGNYIKIEEIVCIGETIESEFEKVLYFRHKFMQHISKNDWIKLKKILKLK